MNIKFFFNIGILRGHKWVKGKILSHTNELVVWFIIFYDKFSGCFFKTANLSRCAIWIYPTIYVGEVEVDVEIAWL